MQTYEDKSKNIFIRASTIRIGDNVSFGGNINIDVRGKFSIGDRSRLGHDVKIKGNNVCFGNDLYHSVGLIIGGGGYTNPTANFTIGDRCAIHNNYVNLGEEVFIGNDVGFSLDVSIQTHGYWLSVLEGNPAKFAGVTINDGVIVGFRSVILMGTTIAKNVIIGACSVIAKDLLEEGGIYVGNPAKFIKKISPLSITERVEKISYIIDEYKKIAVHHGISPSIDIDYPNVKVNGCSFNVETLEFNGVEDGITDHFRDYVRKWGLRYYSNRPFKTIIKDSDNV